MKQKLHNSSPKVILLTKYLWIVVGILLLYSCGTKLSFNHVGLVPVKKREVRAVWMPTIYRSEYSKLNRVQAKALLGKRLERLAQLGCNMVFFQVRDEGDSWYKSKYEPRSRFLTGYDGQDVEITWDPLAYVVAEAHRLGMVVHAWVNPYRAWINTNVAMPSDHAAVRHPDWIVPYGQQLIFDPGNPNYRNYFLHVIKDIITRYDIDGIHLDDYFYPYPIAGTVFNDDASFEKYGVPLGYTIDNKNDWRRNNVDRLIEGIHNLIVSTKPWLTLSIAPFGIYHNKGGSIEGSRTHGLQCYDDLYADVLNWVNQGWVDYIVPQVYWNMGHSSADYLTLVPWWSKQVAKKATLVIGQDIRRTMNSNQLYSKWLMSRDYAQGNSWWPSEELLNNYRGIADSLFYDFQRTKAFLPIIKINDKKTSLPPQPIGPIMEDYNEDGHMLLWQDVRSYDDPDKPFYYAIYAIPEGEPVDITNPKYLIAIKTDPSFKLTYINGKTPYLFIVTTINRFWKESVPVSIRVLL